MTATLKILNGPQKGEEFALQAGENSIGRSSDCVISIKEATVSRHHANIVDDGERFSLKKLSLHGTLKCDGSDVSTMELRKNHKLQIGKVTLLFKERNELESKSLLPMSTEPTDLSAPEPHEMSPLDQEETILFSTDETDNTTSSSELNAPTSSKVPWAGLLKGSVLLLLGLIAYVVTRSIDQQIIPTVVFPYKAGEEKLIDFEGYLKRFKINRRPVSLDIDQPLVMRAQLDRSPLNILWFKSLEQGQCNVTLLDENGHQLLTFKFIIKGAIESRSAAFKRESMTDDQVTRMAKELMAKGGIIGKESPYEAFQYYEEAIQYLETVSTTSSLYFECRQQMKEPRVALEQHLSDLWSEANRYRKNKSYAHALTFVENILNLVKDPHDIDHQRAQIHKKHILRRVK
jgi:hypothetical protein